MLTRTDTVAALVCFGYLQLNLTTRDYPAAVEANCKIQKVHTTNQGCIYVQHTSIAATMLQPWQQHNGVTQLPHGENHNKQVSWATSSSSCFHMTYSIHSVSTKQKILHRPSSTQKLRSPTVVVVFQLPTQWLGKMTTLVWLFCIDPKDNSITTAQLRLWTLR